MFNKMGYPLPKRVKEKLQQLHKELIYLTKLLNNLSRNQQILK